MARWQSDVLSFHRKDGTMVMRQDRTGDIEITDEAFKKQVEEKCKDGVSTSKEGENKNTIDAGTDSKPNGRRSNKKNHR